MKIVVLVKQVPDSGAERNLRPDDGTVDRASANNVINEMDEYAIEEALKLREAHGGEVTVLTMGPERAAESIRKALSDGPGQGGARGRRRAARVVRARHLQGAGRGAADARAGPGHLRGRVDRRPRARSCRTCWPSGSASPR